MGLAAERSFPLVLVGEVPFLSTFTFLLFITFTVLINIYSQSAIQFPFNQKIPVTFISCRNLVTLGFPFSVFTCFLE